MKTPRGLKLLPLVVIALACLSGNASAAETSPPPAAPLGAGVVAPDFATQDPAGKTIRLSDFRGKVVVLDFWAPWCGPCIAAMPHTQEVAAQYKDQGVV
ncbi:MAG: hypothetical protein RJB55_189, partial [Verrucomicrobiota bacterium]